MIRSIGYEIIKTVHNRIIEIKHNKQFKRIEIFLNYGNMIERLKKKKE